MNAMEVSNKRGTHQIAEVLHEDFRTMGSTQFRELLERTIRRADDFLKLDDSEFSSALEENDAVMYACHVRSFLNAVNQLKSARAHSQLVASQYLANCVAFWQVVSVFHTLHGGPTTHGGSDQEFV